MPYFAWYGIDIAGNNRSGKAYARSQYDLDRSLLAREIALISCKKSRLLYAPKPTGQRVVQFFNQSSLLVSSGMRLPEVLAVAIEQYDDSISFQESLDRIAYAIGHGQSIHEAFNAYPNLFDQITVVMLQVGQESGALSAALAAVAGRLESNDQFRKKIKAAALLPLITLLFFLGAALFIFVVIIPSLTGVLAAGNQSIPKFTRVLIGVSDFVRSWQMAYLCLGGVFLAAGLRSVLAIEKIKNWCDSLILRIPFVSNFALLGAQSAFLESLSLLLMQAMPMASALAIACRVVGNKQIRSWLLALRNEVIQGMPLSQAMRLCADQVFTAETRAMIAVAEESGMVANMLNSAWQLQKQKRIAHITRLVTLVQPVLMLLLGLLVAGLIFALYIPLFNLGHGF